MLKSSDRVNRIIKLDKTVNYEISYNLFKAYEINLAYLNFLVTLGERSVCVSLDKSVFIVSTGTEIWAF